MNKTCARCEKTVYPTEELKCLDKVWHKGCFKCQDCGSTLNMKSYKGYGKLPYCETHVPKAKHTTMAETPELKRIAENSKLQSNAKYHAEFEKSKGKCTQVSDDPETQRIQAMSRLISQASYHRSFEKKAQMEKQRQNNENGELVDVPTDYNQQINSYATEMLQAPHLPPKSHYQTPAIQPTFPHQSPSHLSQQNVFEHQQRHINNMNTHTAVPSNASPYPIQHQTNPHQAQMTPNQNRQYQDVYKDDYYQEYPQEYQQGIGKIHDYDPEDENRAPYNTQPVTSTVVYKSANMNDKRGSQQATPSQSRPIGRVTDYDPVMKEMSRTSYQPPAPAPVPVQKVYIAMYDYEANDNDEVSFREGDVISNVSSIDEGWMTGQVLRTGRAGMLPANYVVERPAQPY